MVAITQPVILTAITMWMHLMSRLQAYDLGASYLCELLGCKCFEKGACDWKQARCRCVSTRVYVAALSAVDGRLRQTAQRNSFRLALDRNLVLAPFVEFPGCFQPADFIEKRLDIDSVVYQTKVFHGLVPPWGVIR